MSKRREEPLTLTLTLTRVRDSKGRISMTFDAICWGGYSVDEHSVAAVGRDESDQQHANVFDMPLRTSHPVRVPW